jgi:hypothetical protein
LKQKAFIIEKSLDTAFRCPIRFRQKVLMVFSELRWNYSPLKEKAVLLPDGLFVVMVASRQTATNFFIDVEINLLLMRAARRKSASRLLLFDKICRSALPAPPISTFEVEEFFFWQMRLGDVNLFPAARPVRRRAACFRCDMFSTQAKIYSGVEAKRQN